MAILQGALWVINAHNDGASATPIVDTVDMRIEMVDSTLLTGLNGGSAGNYDYIVEQIVSRPFAYTNIADGNAKKLEHHRWVLKFVYANGQVPATSTTIANIATWVSTAITAFKSAAELTA
jgi:hypothetical protein